MATMQASLTRPTGTDAGTPGKDAGSSRPKDSGINVDASAPMAPDAGTDIPQFVAAGAAAYSTTGVVDLPLPTGLQPNDFMLMLVDAQESSGSLSLAAPAGWTALGGFPIHNVVSSYAPYIIPVVENHGTWIFQRVATAAESGTLSINMGSVAPVRGVVVAYRGVDTAAPIHDKSAHGSFGEGDSNGLGMGNTSLTKGIEVSLVATAFTVGATYTVVKSTRNERVNTGEQPNGLNLIVHDSPLNSFGIFLGHQITNKVSPSGSTGNYLFSATTLVLKPQ